MSTRKTKTHVVSTQAHTADPRDAEAPGTGPRTARGRHLRRLVVAGDRSPDVASSQGRVQRHMFRAYVKTHAVLVCSANGNVTH